MSGRHCGAAHVGRARGPPARAVPLYQRYSAAAFIGLCIAGLGFNDILKRRWLAAAVASPQVGETCVLRMDQSPGGGGARDVAVLQVFAVRGDKIDFCSSYVSSDAATGKKRCGGRLSVLSQPDLAEKYESGSVLKRYPPK